MSAAPQEKSDSSDEKHDSKQCPDAEPKPQESSLGVQNEIFPVHSPEFLRSLAHQHSEMSKM